MERAGGSPLCRWRVRMPMLARVAAPALAAALVLAGAPSAQAASARTASASATDAAALPAPAPMPMPPCGVAPWPAHTPPGEPPAVAAWRDGALQSGGWRPPACTGWRPDARSRVVVALAGRVAVAGGVDALLARAGAVSSMRGIRYWSTRDAGWHELVLEAVALSGPGPDAAPRADFGAEELADGQAHAYRMVERRVGEVGYALRVLERGADRLVVSVDSTSAVRAFGFPLFEPGALQTVVFAERDAPGKWRLYLLSRVDLHGSSVLAGGTQASVANRGLALFRHLAGLPTDREPPAIR
jgi:hypothetical protein